MTKAETLYHEIVASFPDIKEGKMFGALCMKCPNGKAATMFWKEHMIFKLEPKELEKTLELKGVKMFQPMEGRAMNGWAQVPFTHADKWPELSKKAVAFVKKIEK